MVIFVLFWTVIYSSVNIDITCRFPEIFHFDSDLFSLFEAVNFRKFLSHFTDILQLPVILVVFPKDIFIFPKILCKLLSYYVGYNVNAMLWLSFANKHLVIMVRLDYEAMWK